MLCCGTSSVSVFTPAYSKTTMSKWWQSIFYYSTNSHHVMTAWRPGLNLFRNAVYEGFPERIQSFLISREPVAWPTCDLAASQSSHYCTSVNSHSPVGLVSRQWDAVHWACKLCNCRIHSDRASRSASSRQCARQFYSSRAGFLAKHHITQSCQHLYTPDLALCDFRLFPKLKSPMKWRRFVNATITQNTSSVKGISLPTD